MPAFYRIDDESASVRALQKRLRLIALYDGRIPSVFIDGIYGSETEAAVAAFQGASGLEVSGEVDLVTHQAISAEYDRILAERERFAGSPDFESFKDGRISPGDEFDGVVSLQVLLRSMAVYDDRFSVGITGIYDEQTVVAVKLFQALLGAEQDGEVDRLLWNEMTLYSERLSENFD